MINQQRGKSIFSMLLFKLTKLDYLLLFLSNACTVFV